MAAGLGAGLAPGLAVGLAVVVVSAGAGRGCGSGAEVIGSSGFSGCRGRIGGRSGPCAEVRAGRSHRATPPLDRGLTPDHHRCPVSPLTTVRSPGLSVANATPVGWDQRAGRVLEGEAPRRQSEGFWPRNVSPLSILALFRANSRSAADSLRGAQPGRPQPSVTFVMTSPLAQDTRRILRRVIPRN